ncbi:TraB/GumN family protein [Fibrella sp. WM1]|uniref:TraB/GumN family protein n=1 Tax=Fibrella musci TaxID=3242485 RepID=UPI00352252BE
MRNGLFIALILFCLSNAYSQDKPRTIFWKVSKEGSKNESYLFGTFHEVNPYFFDSLTNVVDKLKGSTILFVEERISDARKQPPSEQTGWNTDKWNSLLTNTQDQVFSDFVKKAEDRAYYKLNPLLLTLTTSRSYLLNFCQTDSALAGLMDHHIEQVAMKDRKSVQSLDTEQVSLLTEEAKKFSSLQDSLYASYSIQFMKMMLDDDLTGCDIVSAYKRFDINYEFDVDLLKNAGRSPLLVQRNNRWVRLLENAFSSNNCFVAVGYRHLMYKQGLIQQLRALGYTVTPIPISR